MELTLFRIREFDEKIVVITNAEGAAIGRGILKVVEAPHKIVQPTVRAVFKWRDAPAVCTIASNRLHELAGSWTDGHFTFVLPSFDLISVEESSEPA